MHIVQIIFSNFSLYETQRNIFLKKGIFFPTLFAFNLKTCYTEYNMPKMVWGKEKEFKMATLDDIARELGVSKSTVSKALNGARDVSKAMQKSVLEKAVEMGYSRASRNPGGPRIAIFITNMEYTKPEDFGYDIIVGFRKVAEPAGYQIETISLDQDMQRKMPYDEYMVLHNYCGGLFLGLSLADPWMTDFKTCKMPTVLYDNHISGNPNVTHIGVDNIDCMGRAVKYLKSLGHTRIGYLSSELTAYIYQDRYEAFMQALRANGLTADENLTGSCYHISDCLSQHLPRLLEEACTAIVCSHDMLAHSVTVHCRELGLRIPEDISILGYDDIPLCRYTVPPLSTVQQNRIELGKSAFFAMTSQLNHVPISTLLLHAELIQRASCGPVTEDPERIQEIGRNKKNGS